MEFREQLKVKGFLEMGGAARIIYVVLSKRLQFIQTLERAKRKCIEFVSCAEEISIEI